MRRPFAAIDAAALLAIAVATLALYAPDWRYDIGWGGVSTVGAVRVMNGAVPYRDFWTIYAPGHFYLLALLFRVFGTHLLVEVVAASIVSVAAACVCYLIVVGLVRRRGAALACAAIFVAAMYNTDYFKRLGTYPPAILLLLVTLLLLLSHYRTARLSRLAAAGVVTGLLVTVKHDVGGYTALAILGGLLAYQLIASRTGTPVSHSWLLKTLVYGGAVASIGVPVVLLFGVLAGPDMLRDLVIFPLTDFRYARPERYPTLLGLLAIKGSPREMAEATIYYLGFGLPFLLFLCGLVAMALAVRQRQPLYAAAAVTFTIGFLFHHVAAHVQINTHIVTMSVYASFLGVLFLHLLDTQLAPSRRRLTNAVGLGLVALWGAALLAKPVVKSWEMRRTATAELTLPRVAAFRVSADQAKTYEELSTFVQERTRPDQSVFVGLQRHDSIVIGDVIIYFLLNRPPATRYHELHPGIADTAPVQQEIIRELRDKNVSVILLKQIFSDQVLDRVKRNLSRNLPAIGATDLDRFIRSNYTQLRKVGPYTVWVRQPGAETAADGGRSASVASSSSAPIHACPDFVWLC